jgi:glycosyltransferase involved in cell wall biosynthesis
MLYRIVARRAGAIVTVNEGLAHWSRHQLRVPAERVTYVPNFVPDPLSDAYRGELPGALGARIVCVANIRPQKDHLTLLAAMSNVVRCAPAAHLLLVGGRTDPKCGAEIEDEIRRRNLSRHVTQLGERSDVAPILRGCDVGVLSSASEGFPLALIEYGLAGLPAVATRVGQCAEVLDEGRAGLLVPARNPDRLSDALLELLASPERRAMCSRRLQARVRARYSASALLERWDEMYDRVTSSSRSTVARARRRSA